LAGTRKNVGWALLPGKTQQGKAMKVLPSILTAGLCLATISIAKAQVYKGAPPVNSNAAPGTAVPQMSYEEKRQRTLADSGIAGLDFYPRVSGSTSTIPVGELLVAKALGLCGELRRLADDRSYSSRGPQGSAIKITFPLNADAKRLQEYSALLQRNSHLQTGPAYEALAKGAVDLILVAREPSADELTNAGILGNKFDVRPVALDALVFISNTKNGVTNLTLDQIRDVYTGKAKNWKEIGGGDAEISAVTRDRNSGSEELMRKLVMGDQPSIPGRSRMAVTMGGTLDAVEDDENSLAYSVYYYERVMNPRPDIKPLAINGVLPSSQTIADRTYPLVEPVYVVTRAGLAETEPAAILRNWLLSLEGQKLIAQSGYVPLSK
jgi:ABC-type phosphate transport system substrate-binding protein